MICSKVIINDLGALAVNTKFVTETRCCLLTPSDELRSRWAVNENYRQTRTQKPEDYGSFSRWREQTTRENDESRSRWVFL